MQTNWCVTGDSNTDLIRSERIASAVGLVTHGAATEDRTPVIALPKRCPATGRLQRITPAAIPGSRTIGALWSVASFYVTSRPNHTHLGRYTRTVSLLRVISRSADYPVATRKSGAPAVNQTPLTALRGQCIVTMLQGQMNWRPRFPCPRWRATSAILSTKLCFVLPRCLEHRASGIQIRRSASMS